MNNDEVNIEPISWQAPEYDHKEKSVDFLWAIGLIALAAAGVAIWRDNNVFAIFILVSGFVLIMFSVRPPQEIEFSISNDGLKAGKDLYPWKSLKGFNAIDGNPYGKLLVETSKYFLPVYNIPVPADIFEDVRDVFKNIVEKKEIEESRSALFMEKLGF